MTTPDRHAELQRLLILEEVSAVVVAKTPETAALNSSRSDLLKHVREIGKSNDLAFIVASEKIIVRGDLERYANSPAMVASLKKALAELETVERHLPLVDDPSQYRLVDATHRFPKNRKGGLPWDEARQALGSHYTRLDNLDKSRLSDDEKATIEARKHNIFQAGKLYAGRQAITLGVEG
ncbi:hypothetical protein AGMMS49543_21390 [Betaproteobacteria bacterium]|nr:hypothetical protein AGMMS49543_21390 [Betaproteobacteria bacterium]GHU22845.1 hypothetical protein AGMMS50243_23190 [Betaproteobacteria bacterium]